MVTKPNSSPDAVANFLDGIAHEDRRADALALLSMMGRITGHAPAMWGKTMVGFDTYHYKYDSGREGDNFVTGFSPRKQSLVVYITNGFANYQAELDQLGKHKTSVSCLYINKLADVDLQVLETLITKSYADMKRKYPDTDGTG